MPSPAPDAKLRNKRFLEDELLMRLTHGWPHQVPALDGFFAFLLTGKRLCA